MNNKKVILLSTLAIAVVLSILLTGFFALFEKRSEEIDVGFIGKAAFNPYLAVERFLTKNGSEAESLVSMLKLKQLPATQDVLFLPTKRFDIGPDRYKKILAWVNAGGHLVLLAWPNEYKDNEVDDPFLGYLEITAHINYELESDLDIDSDTESHYDSNTKDSSAEQPLKQSASKKQQYSDGYDKITPTKVGIGKNIPYTSVVFLPERWLETNSKLPISWSVSDDNGAHLIEFEVGQGLITVLSDTEFMSNKHIAKYDHAAFVWYLLRYSKQRGKVWIVFKGDMPPLYEWLMQHAWAFFLALFVLLCVWLWYVLPRFGGIFPNTMQPRRSLLEHITASGNFMWRNKFSQELLHDTRSSVNDILAHRHPAWLKLAEQERYQRIAKKTGLTLAHIRFALATQQTENETEFTQIIDTLERLRKAL